VEVEVEVEVGVLSLVHGSEEELEVAVFVVVVVAGTEDVLEPVESQAVVGDAVTQLQREPTASATFSASFRPQAPMTQLTADTWMAEEEKQRQS
jgi:hypothetical protein